MWSKAMSMASAQNIEHLWSLHADHEGLVGLPLPLQLKLLAAPEIHWQVVLVDTHPARTHASNTMLNC
jgi:hypothetical protein